MSLSLNSLVNKLERAYGVAEWWPSESAFEVAVGAILTQRTSWTNVQAAIGNLKSSAMMSPSAMSSCEVSSLQEVIRPSGFYRQKARYLRSFSSHLLDRYGGDIERMGDRPVSELRRELLSIEGIGPETADTIMLYALNLPSFVVDSYSFRLLDRLGIYSGRDYGHVKAMFERALGLDAKRLSSAHAAVVIHCKEHCLVRPRCRGCPVRRLCPSKAHDDE
ncbi:MAG: endonuclease III domain-containing protein [Thermoplasmata archaeon]